MQKIQGSHEVTGRGIALRRRWLLVAVPLLTVVATGAAGVAQARTGGAIATLRPEQPQTDVPFPRGQAGLAYDEVRQVTLMFGGEFHGAIMNDTWGWDGTKWRLQFPTRSPTPRSGEGMAYDAARRRIVIFGGFGGGRYLSDTWTWNGRTWKKILTPRAPKPRSNMGMVWDAARQVVVLFGGGTATTIFNDIWTWDGTGWTRQSPATSPPKRSDMGMVYAHGEVGAGDGVRPGRPERGVVRGKQRERPPPRHLDVGRNELDRAVPGVLPPGTLPLPDGMVPEQPGPPVRWERRRGLRRHVDLGRIDLDPALTPSLTR